MAQRANATSPTLSITQIPNFIYLIKIVSASSNFNTFVISTNSSSSPETNLITRNNHFGGNLRFEVYASPQYFFPRRNDIYSA